MKSVSNPQAADAQSTPQPLAPGDWPTMLALMSGVLAGLAGDRAMLRVSGDWESVAAPNILIPGHHLRLLMMAARLTDGAKFLQSKLVESSMALRSDLIQELCGGPRRGKEGGDPPLLVREKHLQALQGNLGDEHSESCALSDLQTDLARSRLAHRQDAIFRPMVLLQDPEPKMLDELVGGCHGGRALVLGELPVTTRPTRKHLARLLNGTTSTLPALLRRGQAGEYLALLRISAVLSANAEIIEKLFKHDPEFLENFVIVQPGDAGGLYTTAANGTRNPIPESTWFDRFDGAVARTMATRRAGNQLQGWFRDAGAARQFDSQRHAFIMELEASEFASMGFAEFPLAVAWVISQLHSERSCDQMILALAVKCSRILWQRHSTLLSSIRASHQRTAEEVHEQKILQRVSQCTKATRREVVRAFDNQDYGVHLPVIDGLLTSGKLVTYDNRLVLGPAAR